MARGALAGRSGAGAKVVGGYRKRLKAFRLPEACLEEFTALGAIWRPGRPVVIRPRPVSPHRPRIAAVHRVLRRGPLPAPGTRCVCILVVKRVMVGFKIAMAGPYGQIMAQQGSWQTQFLGLLSRCVLEFPFPICGGPFTKFFTPPVLLYIRKNGSEDRAGTAIRGLLSPRVWVRRSGGAGLGQRVSPVVSRDSLVSGAPADPNLGALFSK